ncbi:MAG: DEAD/DEAH box helicase [Clostridia bacterium]|jgi:superfamily II DNA/RNA helicase|nr:DEAD/DEAH box helicase [Clostridia bacterium]
MTFKELNISENLISGLSKENITTPMLIQEKSIGAQLNNEDVIAKSVTGSGKTLAYLLPLFEKIDSTKRESQAIILAPTHELVMQIYNEVLTLSKNSEVEITAMTAIGEVNIDRQIEKLKKNKPHIIVGTEGRVLDLINKKKLKAHNVKTIIIDEADKLLNVRKIEIIKSIIKTTLKERQLVFFSASITDAAIKTATELMKSPTLILLEENKVNKNIKHMYLTVDERDKVFTLRKLLYNLKPTKSIVFLNNNVQIKKVAEILRKHNLQVGFIYGSATKEDRKKILTDFRTGKTNILISSDLSARGLDIKGVTHIFNLDLPKDNNEYLHRAGRTARGNNKGTTISLVTTKERSFIKNINKQLNITVIEKMLKGNELIDFTNEPKKKRRKPQETIFHYNKTNKKR